MAHWSVIERGKVKYISVLSRVDPHLNIEQLKTHFSMLWATKGRNFSQGGDISIHPHLLYFILDFNWTKFWETNTITTRSKFCRWLNSKSDWLLKLLENSLLVVYLFIKSSDKSSWKSNTALCSHSSGKNFPGSNGISEKIFLFLPSEWPKSKFLSYSFWDLWYELQVFVAILR